MVRCVNNGVMAIKSGHQGEFMFGEHPRKPTILFCDGLGSNIMIQYSVGPIITLHGQITGRGYMDKLGNQVHPMIQTFLNNDAVFQRQQCPPIYTAGTVHSLKSMKVNFSIFPGQHNHLF
jgi:hypothetical protein